MRVAFFAYACDPDGTSEREVGWHWAVAAARDNQVVLFTRAKYRDRILAAIEGHDLENLSVECVEGPRFFQWCKRRLPFSMYPYYTVWTITAGLRARRMNRSRPFDIAHHVTFSLDWLPSPLLWLRDTPTVWGPIGPGVRRPALGLARWLGPRWLFQELMRTAIVGALGRTVGSFTGRHVTVILAGNREAYAIYRPLGPTYLEPHWALPPAPRIERGLHLERVALYAGRLLAWKGVALAIRAIALTADWQLIVCGTGPEERHLRALVSRLGLHRRVQFLGHVPRSELVLLMQEAAVFLFPSTREFNGHVIAEAMQRGVPIVTLDRGGPGTFVDLSAGRRVAPDGDVPGSLARALLVAERLTPCGSGRWDASRLPGFLHEIYRETVQKKTDPVPKQCLGSNLKELSEG